MEKPAERRGRRSDQLLSVGRKTRPPTGWRTGERAIRRVFLRHPRRLAHLGPEVDLVDAKEVFDFVRFENGESFWIRGREFEDEPQAASTKCCVTFV
jgi:hypothetical protein